MRLKLSPILSAAVIPLAGVADMNIHSMKREGFASHPVNQGRGLLLIASQVAASPASLIR